MTILESGEDEPGPSDLLGNIVQQDHDRQCRQECGEQQQPIPGESAQRREAIQDVTAIKKINSGASRLIRYQRSGTRHRKLRRARSHTPSLSAHQGGNDKCWHRRPEE
jgi:hypothetical protein